MRRLKALLGSAAVTAAVALLVGTPLGGTHRAALSKDLADHLARGSSQRVRVIVHGDSAEVAAIAARQGLHVVRQLATVGVMEVNAAELDALSQDPEVDHLSGDVPVTSAMSVTNQATGADQVWKGFEGLIGVTGAGVGVAVIDSGLASHAALSQKVAVNVSFLGTSASGDEYGHGTHIAGIIAGKGSAAAKVTSLYTGGVAPAASLINLRVLGADGSGLTSNVIAAIDWAIANRSRYKIRVLNLSLGHPVMEPSFTDPLCEAVKRAAEAGLVVVASAGNFGKSEDGTPVLGGIVSPGNSPYAITVGALNTWATSGRTDDTITTYSSRGPTRFDLRIKPDVVAPGNKIVSLEANASYLSRNYPGEHVAGSSNNAYFRMSGTSMATAVASGAAALLLQANPSLTPKHVKLALQMGAAYLVEAGLVGGGAGSVNLVSARRIAIQGLADPLPGAMIAGSPVTPGGASYWDPGSMSDRLYADTGMRIIWGDAVSGIWSDPSRIIWGDLNLLSPGNQISLLGANRIIWGNVSLWTASARIIWGDTIIRPDAVRIVWGDSTQVLTADPNRIVWGDGAGGSGDPQD